MQIISDTMRISPFFFAALALVIAAPASAQTVAEKAMICSGCHGESGLPQEKTTPIIWGQNTGYLYLQLRDFKKGARQNELMTPIVEGLEKEDLLALAEYFSAKKWPAIGQPSANKADSDAALRANASVGCTGCHLAQYQGDASVPRTAGQQRDYLAKTMADFRARTRANNPGMSDLMNAVRPEDLAALANYLSGL